MKNISPEAFALIEKIDEIINSETTKLSKNDLQKLVQLKERIRNLKDEESKYFTVKELLGFFIKRMINEGW